MNESAGPAEPLWACYLAFVAATSAHPLSGPGYGTVNTGPGFLMHVHQHLHLHIVAGIVAEVRAGRPHTPH